MSFLDKLERRLGFIAIPGLIRVIVVFNALVFVLVRLNPNFLTMIELDPARVMRGEVWRLFTYIFIPQTFSALWVIFALWFLWFIGEGLERAWGSFRITLYYLVGMVGTTAAAFFFGGNFSNGLLNASLFFAFAHFFPDEMIYIFFVLPVKIKWVAWGSAALLLVGFFLSSVAYRMAFIAAFSNYIIFFGPGLIRAARNRREVATRRARFQMQTREATGDTLHHCAICGATELTDPNLEFRVAANGEEYCVPHLAQAKAARA